MADTGHVTNAIDDANAALRAPLTVLVCLVPLAVLGEALRWHERGLDANDLLADPLLASLGGLIGMTLPILPLVTLIAGGVLAQILGHHAWKPPTLAVISRVALWAAIWATVRVLIGVTYHRLSQDHLAGASGLAICGAVQEELIFRCLCLGGLSLLGLACKFPRAATYASALALSAVFFSLAHTTVINHLPGAETFSWATFAERCAAGLLYGVVFLRQGLAVCTLAHATYNLALVWMPAAWIG